MKHKISWLALMEAASCGPVSSQKTRGTTDTAYSRSEVVEKNKSPASNYF